MAPPRTALNAERKKGRHRARPDDGAILVVRVRQDGFSIAT
jgi:hypothetical protein